MDEELEMVDNSFCQDSSNQLATNDPEEFSILTLEDFLKATGSHFMSHLPTSFRRETNLFTMELSSFLLL